MKRSFLPRPPKRLAALLSSEQGQATTESALVLGLMLTGGGVALIKFLPDMLAAATVYIHGFYLVLTYPIG